MLGFSWLVASGWIFSFFHPIHVLKPRFPRWWYSEVRPLGDHWIWKRSSQCDPHDLISVLISGKLQKIFLCVRYSKTVAIYKKGKGLSPINWSRSRKEYWSGLSCPSPGHPPNSGIEPVSPVSPALQADSLPTTPPEKPTICIQGDKYKFKGKRRYRVERSTKHVLGSQVNMDNILDSTTY